MKSRFCFQTGFCLAVEHAAHQLWLVWHTRTTIWKRLDIGAVDATTRYGHVDISSVLAFLYCVLLYCEKEYVADVMCGCAVEHAAHQHWLTGLTRTTI